MYGPAFDECRYRLKCFELIDYLAIFGVNFECCFHFAPL